MPMFKRGCVVLLVMVASACGGSSSTTAPSTPTPTLAPTPTAPAWTTEGPRLTDASAGFPGQAIADVAAFQLRDGRWRLLFSAGGAIRSAISPDGLTLTMESGIRIDPRAAGDGAMAAAVKVLPLDDGRLRAYFTSLSGMYSAVSSDEGVTFAVEPGIRLAASAVGASVVSGGAVVRTRDGLWRMYFSDMTSTPNAGPAPRKVFSASSGDLLSWSLDAGVRIGTGATLSGSAEHPCAITNSDGSVSIFYFRNNPTGTWTATSSDGVTFTTESMICSSPLPGSGTIANDPDVVRLSDGSLRMYYNAGDDNGGTIYSARRTGASASLFQDRAGPAASPLPIIPRSPGRGALGPATPVIPRPTGTRSGRSGGSSPRP